MNRIVVSAFIASALVVGGCAATTKSPPTASSVSRELDDTMAEKLDAVIGETMSKESIPGVVVGVWSPGGDYIRAAGVADKSNGAPMRADFFQRIGSETKTFTVTAVLQLVDRGKLGLDDPVSQYVDGVPNGDKITLRQLAGMQSGLFNYSASAAFVRDFAADPRRSFTSRQLLDYAFAEPPAFPPGGGFQYSNTNAVLLGLVVEKVSGQSLAHFVRENITTPLGMSHTSFPTSDAIPDPHAQGYTQASPDGPEVNSTDWSPSWASAAGAMVSTMQDLRVWAPALATGKLLKPETQAQRLQTVAMPPIPGDIGYGLGLFNANGWIGHNGSIHGYQTLTIYSPAEQTTVVVFANTDIAKQNAQPSTSLGTAITKVLSPEHVFQLENAIPQPPPPTTTAPR